MLRSDYWYRFPWLLIAAAMILVGLGLAGIYAATDGRVDCPDTLRGLAEKQVLFIAISLAVFALALVPSYVRVARYSYPLYGVSLALLIVLAVMRRFDLVIPGIIYPTNHAYSWISIPGVMKFQPSELTKIAFIMALAYYLRHRKNYRTFRGLLAPFVMALVPTALVLYQPDLGTAMMFLPVLFLMLFAAGARGKHLLAIILLGLAMVPIFYSSMKGYQRMRIDSWLLSGCAERLRFAVAEQQEPPPTDAANEANNANEPRREPRVMSARGKILPKSKITRCSRSGLERHGLSPSRPSSRRNSRKMSPRCGGSSSGGWRPPFRGAGTRPSSSSRGSGCSRPSTPPPDRPASTPCACSSDRC